MKKKLLNLILGLSVFSASSQIVYQEDFNEDDGGWTVESGTDWEWGIPTGDLINYDGSDCDGSAWVTNLSGDYSNGANAIVTSPVMDCSGLVDDPVLAFELYYETESCCDEGWMEYSLDGGTSWTKLLDEGATGWYNDLGNQWWDNTNGGWTAVSNTIPGAAGVATVQVRFVFSSDGSVTREGFGFDNLFVGSDYESITMNGVINITSGEILGTDENIEIELVNNTGEILTGIEVCYTIDAGAPVCETIPGIPAGVSTYTFTSTTEDFSMVGTYELVAYATALDSDPNLCDDTASTVAVLINPIADFPYTETFESPSAFITEGTWEIGQPEEGELFFNRLACSPDSTVLGTNIDGDYPNSASDFVYSPIFNFESFDEDPYVLFDLFRETESCCDEAWMEFTIDGGATWAKVGTAGTGLNWYNDFGNQWWDGDTDDWVYAYHELTGLAGESSVQFRFIIVSDFSVTDAGIAIDNFTIQAEQPVIVQGATVGVSLIRDFESCGFSTADIIVGEFENIGADSLIGFTICYDIGLGPVCETLEDTILPGATYTHEFEIPADLTTSFEHDVILSITSDDDFRTCDDPGTVYPISTDIVALTGTPIVTNISCNGETDGEIFVNPSEGTPGYVVSWEDAEDGFIVDERSAGFHTYTITDANGCTYVDSAEVIEPDVISLAASVTHETEAGNGAIDLAVSGGTAPYTYDWDNDGTGDFDGEDITGLTGGTYVVVVTDANGCTQTLSVVVENTLSVDDLNGNAFSLYPNPTTDAFQISVDDAANEYTMVIYNVVGEVVYTVAITNTVTTVDVSELATGPYMVELSNENGRSLERLIIK